MLKKFISKLFTGLYVSSLLLTVMPQTAFAAVTGLNFVDASGTPITEVSAEVNQTIQLQVQVVADSDTPITYTFGTLDANESFAEAATYDLIPGENTITLPSRTYPAAGDYELTWCYSTSEPAEPASDCRSLTAHVTAPAPIVGALTSSGPYSQTAGYQIPVNQFVYFDFLIDGVPNLPEINGDFATPSAYLDYTVDYGDGSPEFSGSFPVTSNPTNVYHIKDRTYHPGDAFSDDPFGFIFNAFPWFSVYPQDHFYTNPGNYNLTVRANLRSVTGQDLSGVTPFEAIVPVKVYSEAQGPDFAIESAVYNVGADTLTVPVTYTSPEQGVSVFAQSADGSDTWENELLSKLFLEVKGETSIIGTGALVPFASWTESSPETFDAGTGMYTTEYSIQIADASTTLGDNPITNPTVAYLLLRDFDAGSGPLSTMIVLDSNFANNTQAVTEALEMGVNFSTPLPTVEATETVPFTAEITNIAEGTTTLNVAVNLNLGVLEDDYPSTITLEPGQSSYTLTFDDRYSEAGVSDPSICISTDLDPEVKCDSILLTVIEDIPMSVAFQDEGMRVETGESFALSAFVDEIPEAATSISYEIVDNFPGSTFAGQSGTVDLLEGETTAFITLNDLALAELGGHELELCIQNDGDATTPCASINIEVVPAPLAITASLDASSVDPGASVTANFAFQNVDPASANLQTTIQWGDGSTSVLDTAVDTYVGETLTSAHAYAAEGTYSIQICGNDGRVDACSTQTLTVEPPLTVALSLEQTGVNQVAAHAVVSNLDADAGVLPYTINWGEGTVESFSDFATGLASLNLNEAFTYAVEGPYTVEICVQEAAETACSTATIDTTLAPLTLNVTGDGAQVYIDQAQTLSLDVAGIASFAEALNLSVSWGDGTVEETVATGADIAAGTYSLPITHAYTAAGTYTFEVCGNDGRGEVCVSSEVIVKLPLVLELTEPVVTERTISVDARTTGINTGVANLTYTYNWGDETEPTSFTRAVAPGDVVILNGSHTYSTDGAYTAELCVTDGAQTACETLNVEVMQTPLSAFISLADSVDANTEVTATLHFEDTDPVATSLSFRIDWGDGSALTEDTLDLTTYAGAGLPYTHTYTAAGDYTVQLVANDGRADALASDALTVEPPLTVALSLEQTGVNQVAAHAVVSNLDADAGVLPYTINWGEGTTESFLDDATGLVSLNLNEAFTYAVEGPYTVEICVQEAAERACSTATIDTRLLPLSTSLTKGAAQAYIDEAQSFTLDISGIAFFASAMDLQVNWGDGSALETSTLPGEEVGNTYSSTLSHTYTSAGTYTAEVCANDGRGEACGTAVFSVNLPLVLELTEPVVTERTISVDSRVEGINTDVTSLTYTYTWGDDSEQSFSQEVVPGEVVTLSGSHTYAADGSYTPQLCVTDGTQTACQSFTVEVLLAPVQVALSADMLQSLDAPTMIWLDATQLLSTATTASITTNWGDASEVTTTSVELDAPGSEIHGAFNHTYAAEGTYTIEVCVNDGTTEGCNTINVVVQGNDLYASIGSFDTATGLLTYTVGNTGAQGVTEPALLETNNELTLGTLSLEQNWATDSELVNYTAANSSVVRTASFDLSTLTAGESYTLSVCVDVLSQVADFNTENNCASMLVTLPAEETTSGGGRSSGGGSGTHAPGASFPSSGEDVELSSENPFTDLSADSPYFDAVMDLYGQGILQGYEDGTFQAESITNRAEFMKLLIASTGTTAESLSAYGNCFPDVTNQWYASYVCYGKEKGWVQGYPDGLFRPERTVNRAEAIKMLVNVLGLSKTEEMEEGIFLDVEDGAWYEVFVEVAYHFGLITQPADKLLHPADGMSRGALADLLSRALAL